MRNLLPATLDHLRDLKEVRVGLADDSTAYVELITFRDEECTIPVGRARWCLWDNGGEIGAELVNAGELPRMVPTDCATCPSPTAATTALRLLSIMRGRPVDWAFHIETWKVA